MRRTMALLVVLLLNSTVAAESITVLYTNDIESVYEPVASPWRDDMQRMGGMAHLSTLIRQQRDKYDHTILVDAGDMFTGSLSKATEGKLVFDLYSEMGYDAGNLGNHEFEYGWEILQDAMQRARFPVLNANIFFEEGSIPFTRQYAILKTGGIKVGVIGLMGVDAFINTMMKSNRKGLKVIPPFDVAQQLVDKLRAEVDLMVLLTHQNRTAPMQTDKEADPAVLRGFDEDYALAGALNGVDMIVGGHSDHGLTTPVVHPVTGTVIVMTFGQGMHLGYTTFELEETGKPAFMGGGLIPVDSDRLEPDPAVSLLIEEARKRHPDLTRTVASLSEPALRRYNEESVLGNLLADALRAYAEVDIAMIPAGAIRADLQAGDMTVEEVLNVFPFTDRVSVVRLPGDAVRALFEKGVSLDYGLSQFSGVNVVYDSHLPVGERIREILIQGEPVDSDKVYTFATGSFTATGGEGYNMFEPHPVSIQDKLVSDAFMETFRKWSRISPPGTGRMTDLARQRN